MPGHSIYDKIELGKEQIHLITISKDEEHVIVTTLESFSIARKPGLWGWLYSF